MRKHITFHQDAGHGWYEVSTDDLLGYAIHHDISPYSYVSANGRKVYLEEDCDAGEFFSAARGRGHDVDVEDAQYPGGRYPDNSFIRILPTYSAYKLRSAG